MKPRRLVLCGGGAEPRPPRTAKGQLSELTAALYSSLYRMTPRQRGAAVRALEGLTMTNCAWHLYSMREVLLDWLDMASSARARKARARARARKAGT